MPLTHIPYDILNIDRLYVRAPCAAQRIAAARSGLAEHGVARNQHRSPRSQLPAAPCLRLTPPSTSSVAAGLILRPASARTPRILVSVSRMRLCPPKPGSTVMTSTMSRYSRKGRTYAARRARALWPGPAFAAGAYIAQGVYDRLLGLVRLHVHGQPCPRRSRRSARHSARAGTPSGARQ